MPSLPDEAQTTFDLIGIRPVWVDRLGREAILLPRFSMVLLDAALTGRQIDAVIDRVLSEAAARIRIAQAIPCLSW